jgi:hypothetical protein
MYPSSPDPYPPPYGAQGRAPYGAPVPPRQRERLPTIRIPKPTMPQWLLLGGGALTLLGAFLPWSSVSVGLGRQAQTITTSGLQSSFGKAMAVFGVVALALALASLLGLRMPRGLVARERGLYVFLGGEGLLLTVLYLLDGSRVLSTGEFSSASAGVGLYLSIIGAGCTVLGGVLLRTGGSWLL